MSDYTINEAPSRPTRWRSIGATAMHRSDAWGVAFVIGVLCIILHESYSLISYFLIVSFSFAYLFGFVVNDYFDAPHDAEDKQGQHKNFFVFYPISKTQAIAGFIVCSGIILIGFIPFGIFGLMWFGFSILVMWAYSAPPIRLKSRPGFDLIAHAVFVQTYPYLLLMILLELEWLLLDFFVLAICFLSSLSGQLAQQIRDFQVDSITGRTFATEYGITTARRSLSISTFLLGLVTVYGFVSRALPLALLPLVLLFVPTFYSRVRGIGQTSRSYATMSVMLALCYIALLIILVIRNGGAL